MTSTRTEEPSVVKTASPSSTSATTCLAITASAQATRTKTSALPNRSTASTTGSSNRLGRWKNCSEQGEHHHYDRG